MTASDNFNLVEPSNKSPKKRNSSSKGLLREILQKIITNSKNNNPSTLINQQIDRDSCFNKNISIT